MAYVTEPQEEDVARGSALFRAFHHYAADRVVRLRIGRQIPPVLVRLGRLKALVYTSDKGRCGRKPLTYIHVMDTPPWLACSPEGKQLYLIGGRYRVTPRGIEG